jgi:hypothetical protein
MNYLFVIESREKGTRKAWSPIYHGARDTRQKADNQCRYNNDQPSFMEYRVRKYKRVDK